MAGKSTIFKFRFDTSTTAQGDKGVKKYNREFLSSMAPFWWQNVLIIITSILYAYTFVATTRVLGELIDLFVSSIVMSVLNGENTVSNSAIGNAVLKAALFILANTLLSFMQGVLATKVSTHYSHNLRCRLFDKFNHLPMTYIDSHYHDRIYEMLTDSVDAMNQSLYMILGKIISSLLVVFGIMIELFKIDWIVTMFILAVVVIGFFIIYLLSFSETAYSVEHQQKLGEVHREISEFFKGIVIVHSSGRGEKISENICNMNDDLGKTVKKARGISSSSSIITEAITVISLVLALVVGAFRIDEGVISLGVLITVIIYIRKLNEPLTQFNSFSAVFKTLNLTRYAVFDFLDEKEVAVTGEENITCGDIAFENVNFGYYENQDVILDASFTLKQRGITAITGETGAGKSTIIKLMLNFYSPGSGVIKMAGMDISKFNPSVYRQNFTIIPQNAKLFDCSIKENIKYGMENVTDEEVFKVAKCVGADEFIKKLPQGYDTVFTSSVPNLSSGQIQLVLLARAILRKCSYIIFDEATSFVDAETEARLNTLLKELSKDCGIIIIAHRQTAIDIAENIIRISDGRVIEA